jgi:hypothetical protein
MRVGRLANNTPSRAISQSILVSIGTIAFPVMTAVTLGTDLPSLWALQGLFLFAVLIVCGASYPIERFYSVNLWVLVAGIALLAVIVAAQYMRSSATTTPSRRAAISIGPRRWNDGPLSAVSGDDALAFATAFYSEGHPVYARPFAYQHTWGSPRKTTLEKGWAALCFVDGKDRDTGSAIHTVRVRRSVELAGHAWCQKTRCCAHRSAPPGRRSPAVAGLQRRRRFQRQSPATFEPELSDPFYRPEGVRTPCHASRTCW